MSKWKTPILYTTIGALVGSTLAISAPVFAAQNPFKAFQAYLNQDGQTVSKPSAIAYNGTSYFGIWWLEQQLKKDGVNVSWDGKTLSLTDMPVQQSNTLSVTNTNSGTSQSPIFANTISVNGVTYVPISEVQDLLKQVGSPFEFNTKDGGENSDNNNENHGAASYEGAIHKLQDISEKLTEFQTQGEHGDGEGKGELFSSFAGSMMQLQSVIDELNQVSSSQTSTGSVPGVTQVGGTGSSSGSTDTQSTTTASGTQSNTSTPQLSDIIKSLQGDWQSLNTFALQNVQGSTSTSVSGLSSIISDINVQIKSLSSLAQQNQPSGDANSSDSHGDN